ncbi:MAG: permease-like cell division protein FtsX [candidate division Zixibacteria bacterium]
MRTPVRMVIEIFRAVRYEILSTFGTLLTVILAMTLPGALWIISENLSKAELDLKTELTMDVFLKEELSRTRIDELKIYLADIEGITDVQYLSRQDALFKMREIFGLEMVSGLDENPLPPSFVLSVAESLHDPTAAEAVVVEIGELPEVEDVVFAGEMLNRLRNILEAIRIIGLIIGILVAFSAIFIVANTVRVAISDRRKAVEIMQLVGATRSYILTPFVSLGGIIGLSGGAMASLLLWYLTKIVSEHIVTASFPRIYDVVAFILTGLLLGMLGALVATKKHLKI